MPAPRGPNSDSRTGCFTTDRARGARHQTPKRDVPPTVNATPRPPRLAQVAERLCRDFSPAASLFVRLAETDVAVTSDSPALIAALAGYFREFSRPPGPAAIAVRICATAPVPPDFCPGLVLADRPFDPRETASKEQWADLPDGRVVRKKRTGMVFAFGDDLHVAAGPGLEHMDQVVNFINFRVAAGHLSRGCLLAHASGVAFKGRGLLLAGTAGAGKSTLALRLVARGLDFVSNDRLLVGPDAPRPRLYGLAKQPRINPGTALSDSRLARIVPEPDRSRYAALPEEALWRLERKYDAVISDCFGPGRFRLCARLCAVAVFTWRRGGGDARPTPVNLAERPDLLARLAKRPGIFLAPPGGADHDPEAFSTRLNGMTAFEFSGGVDFFAAEDFLLDILGA